MAKQIDDVVEEIVTKLSPLWGPFYAIFYILRLLWVEMTKGKEDSSDK